ncbi:MAG: hypothetical protein AB8E15_08875 [Bdellovibrionales bacterium]
MNKFGKKIIFVLAALLGTTSLSAQSNGEAARKIETMFEELNRDTEYQMEIQTKQEQMDEVAKQYAEAALRMSYFDLVISDPSERNDFENLQLQIYSLDSDILRWASLAGETGLGVAISKLLHSFSNKTKTKKVRTGLQMMSGGFIVATGVNGMLESMDIFYDLQAHMVGLTYKNYVQKREKMVKVFKSMTTEEVSDWHKLQSHELSELESEFGRLSQEIQILELEQAN